MNWKTFYQLTLDEQTRLHKRHGEVAKERFYLWDEASNGYVWRPDNDSEYAVLRGSELALIGMLGYSAPHLWVILPIQVSKQVWQRIADYQRTGVVSQQIEAV